MWFGVYRFVLWHYNLVPLRAKPLMFLLLYLIFHLNEGCDQHLYLVEMGIFQYFVVLDL